MAAQLEGAQGTLVFRGRPVEKHWTVGTISKTNGFQRWKRVSPQRLRKGFLRPPYTIRKILLPCRPLIELS